MTFAGGTAEKSRIFHEHAQDNVYFPSHKTSAGYEHIDEDIKLMAEMDFKMYWLSIAWTRIFLNGDETQPNQAGLDYYRHVFEFCRKYDIEPLVTISHYEIPYYLSK
ncbi:glycoside hydrolase family 1 protein [Lactobacillus sp. DCY120]|uniref:Glycoside hydrolase family 1 protein n=1 Tax=Bombilactobacillus apium TaxID=2675299 RepID=A0A850R6V0_9LACO|nr:glycoside hydrolase family 1 protein [Bombilactobacillus apium]